jgi:hypothetical protein
VKKYLPYILLVVSIIICTFLWDKIKIPYDESNLIQGEYFFKKYNPNNEIIRFLIFIFIPLGIFLVTYLKFNEKTYSLHPKSNNFFLKKNLSNLSYDSDVNHITFILIIIISLEFFIIDFNPYLSAPLDRFHEGTQLVPTINYIFKKSLWTSTLYDYGLVANSFGILFWKTKDLLTIGSIRFIMIILVFFNKLLLILICRRISLTLNFDNFFKNIFFLILSLSVLNFSNYENISSYPPRTFIFLLFFLITTDVLIQINRFNFKSFIVGSFSTLSFLWWIDMGAYINAIIMILLIYLVIANDYKKIKYILLGLLTSWFIFFIYFPQEEIKELFIQLKFIYSTHDYLLGIEYPRPFSEHSVRGTRALLLIIISGVYLIILNFNKKINLNYETKIIICFLFISSIIFFKSGLMRTDTPHIKYSSGSYLLVFYFSTLYFIFYQLQYTRFHSALKSFYHKFKTFFLPFIIITSFIFIINLEIKNILKILDFKSNANSLINANDEEYLTDSYREFINYYAKISSEDNCIQVLTDDVSLPYLLKKPSCTQFYNPALILSGWNEKKFIDQIYKSSPNIILFKSPSNILFNPLNMPLALKYVEEKYSFYENYNGYIFYKKK